MLRSLILRTLTFNFGLAALGLGNSILLSRWLGPVGRGEVAAAMLWPTLLIYLSSMGLITSVLYFASLPRARAETIFANAIVLAGIQAPLAMLAGFVALPYLLASQAGSVVSAGRLYLLVIPLSLSLQYGTSILQGRMHFSAVNWLRTIVPLGYLTGTVSLMAVGQLKLFNIIILHLGLNLLSLCCTLITLLRTGIRLGLKTDGTLAKRMFKYGAKVQVGTVSGLANQNLDQALMAAWLPPAYLGLYVVAVSSSIIPQMISQGVQMVLTPSIAQKETQAERLSVLTGAFRRYWMLSFLVTAAIGAVLPVAIPLVFGASFKGAVWPAEVLLLGTFFYSAKEVLAGGAQALGNPWLSSKAHLYAVGVTVVLLYTLLPLIGIMGAAVASAAACGLQLVIVVAGLRRHHAINTIELFRVNLQELSYTSYIFDLLKEQRVRAASDQS